MAELTTNRWVGLAIVGAMLALGLLAFARLPEAVPTHWNASGEVDDYMNRLLAVLFMPLVALALWALLGVLPKADPVRADFSPLIGVVQRLSNTILLFLAFVQVLILGAGLGWQFSVLTWLFVATGVLLFVIGAQIRRVPINSFIGVRLPWTMTNEVVWRKSNLAGGYVLMAAGALIVVCALALPDQVASLAVIAVTFGAVALMIGYSYVVAMRERPAA